MAFQNVNLGKDQVVDLDTINKFVLNDNYIEDTLTPCARGIVAWKQFTSNKVIVYDAGTQVDISGMSLDFTAEENRFYTFNISWSQATRAGVSTTWTYFTMRVDDVDVDHFWTGFLDTSKASFHGMCLNFVPEEVVPAGLHTVQFAGNTAISPTTYNMIASATNPIQMWVRDHGEWIAPS